MLKKKYRLRSREVRKVLSSQKLISSPLFLVKSSKNNHSHVRFAVVISKKVSKSAVRRNRIRRAMYKVLSEVPAILTNPLDVVIMVKSPIMKETIHAWSVVLKNEMVKIMI